MLFPDDCIWRQADRYAASNLGILPVLVAKFSWSPPYPADESCRWFCQRQTWSWRGCRCSWCSGWRRAWPAWCRAPPPPRAQNSGGEGLTEWVWCPPPCPQGWRRPGACWTRQESLWPGWPSLAPVWRAGQCPPPPPPWPPPACCSCWGRPPWSASPSARAAPRWRSWSCRASSRRTAGTRGGWAWRAARAAPRSAACSAAAAWRRRRRWPRCGASPRRGRAAGSWGPPRTSSCPRGSAAPPRSWTARAACTSSTWTWPSSSPTWRRTYALSPSLGWLRIASWSAWRCPAPAAPCPWRRTAPRWRPSCPPAPSSLPPPAASWPGSVPRSASPPGRC